MQHRSWGPPRMLYSSPASDTPVTLPPYSAVRIVEHVTWPSPASVAMPRPHQSKGNLTLVKVSNDCGTSRPAHCCPRLAWCPAEPGPVGTSSSFVPPFLHLTCPPSGLYLSESPRPQSETPLIFYPGALPIPPGPGPSF